MTSASSLTAPSVRRPEIDGLRAIVAIWVMCDHFGLSGLIGMHYGFLGVRLMLVFSAYFAAKQLRLLWASGPAAPAGGVISKLVHYYSTRVTRLGLLTYATIALAVLLNVNMARETWSWHALFATNAYIVRYSEWPGALSHFWSLAVQMQFLLVLPVVLLLVSRRGLWMVIGMAIVAAIAHRSSVMISGAGDFYRWMPIANSLDAFAMGIALAWVERERPQVFARLQSIWVALAAVGALVLAHTLRRTAYYEPLGVFTETFESMALALFFGALLGGRRFGPVGWVLGWKPLAALGAASLSIYALHPIAHQVLTRLWLMADPGAMLPTLAFQWSAVGLSLVVACVAYQLLEIPAKRFSSLVEPWLVASCRQVVETCKEWSERRSRPATAWGWRHQPLTAVALVMLLGYAGLSPLRVESPLGVTDETPPLAIEEMEENLDDLPSLYLLDSQETIIDDEPFRFHSA